MEISGSSNVGHQRTSFHGRQPFLDLLDSVLAEGRRLITMLGPPGVGKTRLARHFLERRAGECEPRHPGGMWLVELSQSESPADLMAKTAGVLSIPLSSEESGPIDQQPDRIGWALAGRGPILVLFDNFEHLVPSCRNILDRWLSLAPQAVFLVTSRHRLDLEGEVLIELSPLDLPAPDEVKAEALCARESVALFVDRASLVRPAWQPSAEDLKVVADIVRRLDGLPLAIELAAARMDMLNPAEIDARLQERFRLLERVSIEKRDRQTSLTASIQWSWDQLETWERSVLGQLTVFKGGFTTSHAEEVVDISHLEGAPSTIEVLGSLKAKSLLSTDPVAARAGRLRFFLLESICEFAAGQFQNGDELRRARRRHAVHFSRQGYRWSQAVVFSCSLEAARLLSEERDNLQAVFNRSVSRLQLSVKGEQPASQPPDAIDLSTPDILAAALALAPIFHASVPLSAFESVIKRLKATVEGEVPGSESVLAFGRYIFGEVYRLLDRSQEACRMFLLARESAERSGQLRLVGLAMLGVARIRWEEMAIEEAIETAESALTCFDESREPALVAAGQRTIALAKSFAWDLPEAIPLWETALSTAQRWGILNEEIRILIFFGRDLWMNREFARLKEYRLRALEACTVLGDPWLKANGLMSFAYLLSEPDCDDRDLIEALSFFKGFGSHVPMTSCALACAFFWLERGREDLVQRYADEAREHMQLFDRPSWLRAELLSLEAMIEWEKGNLQEASLHLERAIELCRETGHLILEVVWLSQLVALESVRGHPEEAREALKSARTILDRYRFPILEEMYGLSQGFLDLLRARRTQATGDKASARALCARVRRSLVEVLGPLPPQQATVWNPNTSANFSPDLRMIARKLELELDPVEQSLLISDRLDPEQKSLLIDARGRWFRTPSAQTVDLRSRIKLCNLLANLADIWTRAASGPSADEPASPSGAPVRALNIDEIAALVWPDEKLVPRSKQARVQVAISTLRKMGLKSYLLRNDDGYHLDPGTPVKIFSEDLPTPPHLSPS